MLIFRTYKRSSIATEIFQPCYYFSCTRRDMRSRHLLAVILTYAVKERDGGYRFSVA